MTRMNTIPPDERAVTDRSARAATLVDLLERAACSDERGLRLLDRRERARFLSWRQIHAGARDTAARLVAAGIAPGERVPLIHPTGGGFFGAFFGTLLAGAVPVPLYPPVRLGRLDEYHLRTARMVGAVGARLVLADRRVRRLLGPMVEEARPALGCSTLEELPEPSPSRPGPETEAARRPGADDLALVQFSSGTTVDPKPVALTHRAVLAQVGLLNDFWPDTDEVTHSGVSWLPLYHDMGLIGCVFPALERAADLTLIGPEVFVARPAVWLRAISRYRATISPAPNFAYGLCVAKIEDRELSGVDLASWRVALNGAETVSATTLRAFTERFRPYGFRPEALTPVYGLSEAALAVTFSPIERPFSSRRFERPSLEPGAVVRPAAPDPPGDPGEGGGRPTPGAGRELVSVGRPLPGFELEIRTPEGGAAGAPLPEGRVGRLWVRGPSLMEGYLGRAEENARALVDGWLDTGDLGFLDGGELYLTGRAKDVVIVRGRNVAPEEIEAAAARAPGARTGCAVAVSWMPDGSDSEELMVFVELARSAPAPEQEGLAQAVVDQVLASVGLVPDRVEVLSPGTLPRTSSGKLRRAETLRRWSVGRLEAPAPVDAVRLATAMLRSKLAFGRAGKAGRPEGSEAEEDDA